MAREWKQFIFPIFYNRTTENCTLKLQSHEQCSLVAKQSTGYPKVTSAVEEAI
jgi:hypothetical protein